MDYIKGHMDIQKWTRDWGCGSVVKAARCEQSPGFHPSTEGLGRGKKRNCQVFRSVSTAAFLFLELKKGLGCWPGTSKPRALSQTLPLWLQGCPPGLGHSTQLSPPDRNCPEPPLRRDTAGFRRETTQARQSQDEEITVSR